MAKFVEQTLRSSFEGPYVMFDLNVKMSFYQDEIGTKWRLDTIIVEKDTIRDDLFRNKNWGRSFEANKETVSLKIHVPIHKDDMNTEPGLEEVFAKLTLKAVDGNFPTVEAKTDIIKVDV